MLSIVYFTRSDDSEELTTLEETVLQHAKIDSIPVHIVKEDALSTLSDFIRDNVKTPYVMLAKSNTYLHLVHLRKLLDESKKDSFECFANHFDQTTRTIDADCGFLVKKELLSGFSPAGGLSNFSSEFTRQMTSHSSARINIRPGFNKQNFEASYMHTHHCETCISSFNSGIVYTLGNMSKSDMLRYHSFVDRQRNGKGVTMAIALMIKDEEEKIQETMSHYKNATYFPEIFILDTGSTDKTLERVREWQAAHPATRVIISESPFVDFSTTRNILLDQAYRESSCDYIMSTDCNDEMRGQDDCFKVLHHYAHFPVIFIDQVWSSPQMDPITFSNIRIVKNNGQYRWRYRVHEVLMNIRDVSTTPTVPPLVMKLPPSVHLYQFRDNEYEGIKSARYHRDLTFFLEDYEKTPKDRRIVYYLAQTYFFTNDFENAIVYCKKRIELNPIEEKDEEVYHSLMRICRCKILLKKPVHNIKKWLWRSWEYYPPGKKDIEPLILIANYYEQEGDIDTAMHLYMLCCSTTRPNHSLPLRLELYQFERFKKLAEMYYRKEQFDKIYPTYMRVLETGTPNQCKEIENLVSLYYPSCHKPSQPVVVLYGGLFYDRKWNGKMFFERKIALGGSETMVIRLAHLIAAMKRFQVYVFVNTDEEMTYEGVTYVKMERYNDFCRINTIRHLILSRDAERAFVKPNRIEKTHLWIHDLTHIGTMRDESAYNSVITLTPFHRTFYENEILGNHPQRAAIAKKGVVIPNFVQPFFSGSIKDYQRQLRALKPTHHRIIYSSCPSRGLLQVVNEWPIIRARYPDAELWLYCDFNNDYIRKVMPQVDEFLAHILTLPGVHNVGRLPEAEFIEHCKKATVWYYPTEFKETFCITAVQMMGNGVIPVYRKTGSLPSVVGDAGIIVTDTASTLEALAALQKEDYRNGLVKKGLERSRQYVEETVKKDWEKLLA